MLLLASLAGLAADPVSMSLVPSGATQKVGYYSPRRAPLAPEPTAKGGSLAGAKYGTLELSGKKVAFALAEPEGAKPTMLIDANGNGDLADETPKSFDPPQGGASVSFMGDAMVDIGKGQPVKVAFYRFDEKKNPDAGVKSALFYYPDYGYELGFSLDGKPFKSFVSGDPGPESGISVDRNGDGEISAFKESVTVGKPFNYTGTTYKFVTTDAGLALEATSEKLPMAPLPPNLSLGAKTLPIVAKDMDGKPLDLMKDYKGKLVMLDFWATWCGPCIAELPNVKAAYKANRAKGFDVLGISFDDAAYTTPKLKEFLKKNDMPWRQLYEGKGWETKIGGDYDVSGIPFTLLVDGDTGEIVGTQRDLRGPGLSAFIEKKLAEKKAKAGR